MTESKKAIYLLDGSSLIYRAFYAMPRFTTTNGKPTGAILGFGNMLLRLIEDFHPHSILVSFDSPQKTFRHQLAKEYKAQRKPMPDELIVQMQEVKDMITLFGFQWIEKPGFEGDDIIGSLCRKAEKEYTVAMVSSDLDFIQLINDNTFLLQPVKGVTTLKKIDLVTVQNEFGITPRQIIDLIALTGDPSDNIQGLPGIGEKTALDLLRRYQNWEGILKHADELPPRLQKTIDDNQDRVSINRQLATIVDTIPIDAGFQIWNFQQIHWSDLFINLDRLELKKFKERLMKKRNELKSISLNRAQSLFSNVQPKKPE